MTYIIADPDKSSGGDLKKILDDYNELVFRGSFTTLKTAENGIRKEAPDIAFIRLGSPVLNAFRLAVEIKTQNPRSKIIYVGSDKESAVEAFEHEADGFLLTPFNKMKIGLLFI